jgi:hypothetical protein
MRWAVIVQPFAAAAVAATYWQAPAAMVLVPGLQEAANSVCSYLRFFVDAVVFLTSQASTLPSLQPPNAHVQQQQQQELGSCVGAAAFYQLMIFSVLLLAFFVPLYLSYRLEFHQKVSYWEAQGIEVEADASPFMPLPSWPCVSCILVLCMWPVLLWCVAEAVVDWAVLAGA